ncbi:hypothetical protein [Salipiger abyssi]|uniref:Uncharacterized protein n=1 Tax=Salipiger abyssi TaxID=1250539 RepID=A0A1P8UWA8_9RHOB|nr:hypothetical protein [Salipiger abyssi]APZ53682.1 hypothetical protein Ga0080574_TMP3348 [Salipiger abyssi]
MMPMTPMDWSLAMMRAGSQVMGAQIRLAQVMCEAGMEQQQRLWGLRAPDLPVKERVTSAPGACVSLPPRAVTRLRAVPAAPGAQTRRRAASKAPIPVLVARSGDADLSADI